MGVFLDRWDNAGNAKTLTVCDGAGNFVEILLAGTSEQHVLGAVTADSLAVSKSIMVGFDDQCDQTRHGALRWDQDANQGKGRLELCAEGKWAAVYEPPPISCQDAKDKDATASSGMYVLANNQPVAALEE